jgi:hypothetical protein
VLLFFFLSLPLERYISQVKEQICQGWPYHDVGTTSTTDNETISKFSCREEIVFIDGKEPIKYKVKLVGSNKTLEYDKEPSWETIVEDLKKGV